MYFCFTDYTKAFDCVDHNKLWKILKDMGVPDHITCLLETCMQIKKQQLEPDTEQQTVPEHHLRTSPQNPVFLPSFVPQVFLENLLRAMY